MAMWDLCGRITQQPVHKLLGGRRERIKCYASSLFNVGSPSDYADHAEACIRRGYKGYKIHPFVNRDPQTFELLRAPGAFPMHDINVCCEIRDRLGESVPLMHDPYGAYNFEQAVHVGKTLEELKFAWFEHPMQENRIDLYQRLRQMIRVPLCGPETVGGGPFSRVEWILRGATDITRIDVHHGGITGCWKLLNFCMLQQVRCELHLGGAAELQLAAAAGEDIVEYFERFVIDPDKVLGEPAPYLKSPWLRIEDGWAIIPQTAGLGFELDWDYIKRHKV
jgi:L-alanine-DL-glutamate epimerase-like enolase superfamily enzyme